MKSFTIIKGEQVRLVKEMKDLLMVGQVYEVANITETSVVIRNKDTKVACASVHIDEFFNHFEKLSNDIVWTNWIPMVNSNGAVSLFYRTNHKKVQVKASNGLRSEATCNKEDEFNLELGIQIAVERLMMKAIKHDKEYFENQINLLDSDLKERKHRIKVLISKVKPIVVEEVITDNGDLTQEE